MVGTGEITFKNSTMKLRIKVTKDILEKSKMCGGESSNRIGENCAIALAVRDIFPNAYVDSRKIHALGYCEDFEAIIYLPQEARDFIDEFDGSTAEGRVKLDPIDFEIELTSTIISKINIDQAKEAIKNSKTLELI
jgi:hypothetical protein